MKINLEWISDVIKDDYKKWQKGDIVLIEAQTGTGKTYYIKDKLIPSLKPYEKLLLVCNRTNLKRQLKIDLLKKFGQTKLIPVDKKGNVDFEKLDGITQINDNITITSYHAISESLLDKQYHNIKCDLDAFDYIVCDEAHFLIDDGNFNNKCRLAFQKLVQEHCAMSIKIFISATLTNISNAIEKNADKVIGKKPTIHPYTTGVDYSYLNIKYFDNDLDIIINLIKNDTSDEKWMVFVTKKEDAKYIEKNLKNGICSCIFSGNESKELKSIVNTSKFNKKVLICTKVLDNGINIQDGKLTNLVVMAWDKTTFIQEIGRKRVNIENAQQVNLYLPLRYKKSFDNKVRQCEKLLEQLDILEKDEDAFNRLYDNGLDRIADLNNLIYRNPITGKWTKNLIGLAKLHKDKDFFESMSYRFYYEGKFAFIYQQLEWLDQHDTFRKDNLIDNVILQEKVETLNEFLESILGKVMLEVKDRRELITKIGLVDPHHSNTKNGDIVFLKSIDTLNDYLSKEIDSNFYIKEFSTSRVVNGKKKSFNHAWKVQYKCDSKLIQSDGEAIS